MSDDTYGIASYMRGKIADALVIDDRLTLEGAHQIKDAFIALPSEVRGAVFRELDNKPGQWSYKDAQGREYHYKLRQFRNGHRDLMREMFTDNGGESGSASSGREYQVAIILDVVAGDREEAGAIAVEQLVEAGLTDYMEHHGGRAHAISSWWTLDARDKKHDGNDNDAGRVVFDKG